MAGMLVMGMYWPEIQAMEAEFIAAGKPLVANGAPASILCSFPNTDQTNLGYVFMTEFFVDSFIGIVIWACLDPANVGFSRVPFQPRMPRILAPTTLLPAPLLFSPIEHKGSPADFLPAVRCTGSRPFYHRTSLRKYGVGIRRCHHLYQSCQGLGYEDCGFDILRT